MRFPIAGRRSGRSTEVTLRESAVERPRRSRMARAAAAGSALTLAATATAVLAASPASAAPVCAGNMNDFPQRISLAWINYEDRIVELRYSAPPAGNRCAWGRIRDARPGDTIWVDWSNTGGRTWEGLLGYNTVRFHNNTHTTHAYSDAGFVMRACTNLGRPGQGAARCTAWR